MEDQGWLEKYRPQSLSEVIGDRKNIDMINDFIGQFLQGDPEKIKCPNLIISGNNGIGKTLITDLAISSNGFEKRIANLSSISVSRKVKRAKTDKGALGPHRDVNIYYQTLTNSKQLTLTGNFEYRKIVLVIDDASNITNPKDREIIKALVKINNKYKKFPIIITTNRNHSKTVIELRKLSTITTKKTAKNGRKINSKTINEIFLYPPSSMDLENLIKNICSKENLVFRNTRPNEDDIHIRLIEYSQFDVRKLINALEDIKTIFGNDVVTTEKLEIFLETAKKKDVNIGIHIATGNLLNNFRGINTTLRLYSEERATIPLMIHENYSRNICNQYRKMPINKKIQLSRDISRNISISDKVDGLIYSNQLWSLQSVHGFYSCVMPSYLINKYPNKECREEKYEYTKDYNKTSIKKINNKVIKKAQEHPSFKQISVVDFLYISFIFKSLLERKDFETIANLVRPYRLKLNEIESIIKIDKINKDKNVLTGKQKKTLEALLEN